MKTQIKIKKSSLNNSKHLVIHKIISCLLTIAVLNLSVSCSYYTVKDMPTTKETISETVKNFNEQDKYAIIHNRGIQWHLKDIIINDDEQMLVGMLRPVSSEHQFEKKVIGRANSFNRIKNREIKKQDSVKEIFSTRESKRVHRYKKTNKSPLNEVHFYLNNGNNYKENQQVSIPFSGINKISINDRNTGRSIANVAVTYVGAVAFAVLLIVALKSSCPFIYIKNGEEFDFVGELYPGTITPNMQKDDYLPLPNFESENDEYTLKIANHLKEVQYTDHVQLVLVNHEKNVKVLLDSEGQLQTFSNLVSPFKVTQDNDINNMHSALEKDNDFYAFNTPISTKNNCRNVVFEFEKPKQVKQAKLYLTAKNSVWLDYSFGKFNEQFGYYYKTFQKKQQKIKGDSINQWIKNQHIPLSVYKKAKLGWELVERISSVGPLAMRDLVIPISMEGISGNNIEIKLETGFMFWEVDYVAMDFSENIELKAEYVNPSKAIDQKGIDVTNLLSQKDNNYFIQPHIGDEVIVSFSVPENKEGFNQSIFLKNRGYYNYIRDYKGIPDFEKLKTFREPNTFTKFSEDAYFNFVNFNPNDIAYHE